MLILCTKCLTKFNLPDSQVKVEAKLRCTICQHAFPIEEGVLYQDSSPVPEEEKENYIKQIVSNYEQMEEKNLNEKPLPQAGTTKKTSIVFIIFLLLILSAIIGFVSYSLFTTKKEEKTKIENKDTALQEQIKDLSIKDFRQYFISNNKKIPPFFVIEGKVKNNSKEAKAFVAVKASIFNAAGKVLVENEMLAGVTLSLFQLQTMTKEDMQSSLTDPLEIAVTNANIPPQDEVPFMILFFDPPKDLAEFSVQIISASPALDEPI